MDRFLKQMLLSEVGTGGQRALSEAKVLVVGCGGLAAPVGLYLAGAGVGSLGLVDHDLVDVTNLQRQVMFGSSDIGHPKVRAARSRLEELNSGTSVHAVEERLMPHNASVLAEAYDVLVDCTDNFEAKLLVNDTAMRLGKPLVLGSAVGFEGQFGVFHRGEGGCYRCLYPDASEARVTACDTHGVLGPAVGVIGSWQALECIKVILHRHGSSTVSPAYGRISVVDFLSNRQSSFLVPRRPGCVCAGGKAEIRRSGRADLDTAAGEISWYRALCLEEAGFLDVREEPETASGVIPGARIWPLSRLRAGELPPFLGSRKAWVLYCRSGMRSRVALDILRERLRELELYSAREGLTSPLAPLLPFSSPRLASPPC